MVVPIETFPMGGELIETGCLDFSDAIDTKQGGERSCSGSDVSE